VYLLFVVVVVGVVVVGVGVVLTPQMSIFDFLILLLLLSLFPKMSGNGAVAAEYSAPKSKSGYHAFVDEHEHEHEHDVEMSNVDIDGHDEHLKDSHRDLTTETVAHEEDDNGKERFGGLWCAPWFTQKRFTYYSFVLMGAGFLFPWNS